LKTIINDILDLATIDAGALELSLAPIMAREVIDAAVVGVRERLKHGNIDLAVRIGDDVEDFPADGQRMTQVLFNLLSNAIGFSEPGSRITLDCRAEGDMIAFSVEDQGTGIPEDYQESVFDRFETRAHGSRHRGAGLGLAIVQNLVELHGGSVSLKSAPGVGTTVTVRLPLDRETVLAPSLEAEVREPDAGTPPAAATG
jgi:signal transduction histidine kinase